MVRGLSFKGEGLIGILHRNSNVMKFIEQDVCVVHVVQHENVLLITVKYEAVLRVFVSCLHCFPRYTGNWIYWPRYHAGQPQLSGVCLLHESSVYLPWRKIRSAQGRSREAGPLRPPHTHISHGAIRALPAAWISYLPRGNVGLAWRGEGGGFFHPHIMILAEFVLFLAVNCVAGLGGGVGRLLSTPLPPPPPSTHSPGWSGVIIHCELCGRVRGVAGKRGGRWSCDHAVGIKCGKIEATSSRLPWYGLWV